MRRRKTSSVVGRGSSAKSPSCVARRTSFAEAFLRTDRFGFCFAIRLSDGREINSKASSAVVRATRDGRRTTAQTPLLKSPFPLNYLGELLYRHLERRLAEHTREFLRRQYDLKLERIVIEQPPKVEFGEFALPLAFELAKKLRKAPRKIAEEIVAGIGAVEGFEKFEVAGAGYINARVDRGAVAAAIAKDEKPAGKVSAGKILVEHTSINPNKAAH